MAPDPDHSRRLLFVVGMHRSGTSALCAALQASGVSFGAQLLDPMAGVNDEGFWEDQAIVSINERLLQQIGHDWYTVPPDLDVPDWSAQLFDALRDEARARLAEGFGGGAVEAVKDPRFCLTLSFWLALAAESGLETAVCVIGRAPLEVAASLQKRDGFPVAYGLRLCIAYRRALAIQAPAGTHYMSYGDLLDNPEGAVTELAQSANLPLAAANAPLEGVVRGDLRHQSATGDSYLATPEAMLAIDTAPLCAAVEAGWPDAAVQPQLARALVARGQALTDLGDEHSLTLATLNQRDADTARLAGELAAAVDTVSERDDQLADFDRRLSATGQHLEQALATIAERDEQIREFDRRLAEIGQMHSEALALIEARDAQLQRVFAKPGIGTVFKAMWSRESG